jgi:glycosyltransferase involved in cell wall biosynthesis
MRSSREESSSACEDPMKSRTTKVVMVGDCASVGETLVHYAPDDINYQHLKRTRSIYSKTLGITLSILRSKGDVYHVHYGLQDHFITKLLKRQPTICHVHGSDLRYTIKGPYGWIVKRNLKTANRVIVAVPDILETAISYRPDAQYVSNPVNFSLFNPTSLRRTGNELRVLFASALSFVKGAQHFARQYAVYQKANPHSTLYLIRYGEDQLEIIAQLHKVGVKFRLLEPVPHTEMPSLYYNSDIVVTDFRLGYLHMTSLEAMACYRPVVQYINNELYKQMKVPVPPVVNVGVEDNLSEEFERLADQSTRESMCTNQQRYVQRYHNPVEISRKIAEVYHEVIGNK